MLLFKQTHAKGNKQKSLQLFPCFDRSLFVEGQSFENAQDLSVDLLKCESAWRCLCLAHRRGTTILHLVFQPAMYAAHWNELPKELRTNCENVAVTFVACTLMVLAEVP
jgi:hypothetical protein